MDAGIKDVDVVLCVAGPFSATSRPMADACLRNRVHYLDITGEIDVFEALAAHDAEASARGVTLLPGRRLRRRSKRLPCRAPEAPVARRHRPQALSVGSARTRRAERPRPWSKSIAAGTRVRRRGAIIARHAAEAGSCDFGQGVKSTVQVSWGDVATAFHSTGIPNIEVHFEASPPIVALARAPSFVKAFLGLGFMQSLLKAQVDRMPEGPSEAARRAGRAVLVGEARNKRGETVRSRLRTPEGYALTAATALDAAKRVAAGEARPGFQTPSLAFGADYILNFDGVTREDLNR